MPAPALPSLGTSIAKSGAIPCLLGSFAISLYLFLTAWWCLPAVSSDAHLFMGTAIRYAQGHGLTNPAYAYRHLDATGKHRIVTYPPLFHWLVGAVMPSSDPRWAFMIVALMRVLQIVGWAWIFFLILQRLIPEAAGRWLWSVPVLQCAVISEGAGPVEGRPEALVALLHVIVILLFVYLPIAWHSLVGGIVLGLIGASHPVGAILSGLAMAVYAGVRFPIAKAMLFLSVAAVTSLSTCLLVFASSEVSAREVLEGAGSVLELMIARAWGEMRVLIFGGRAPLCGLLMAAGLLMGFILLRRHRANLGSPSLAFAAAILFSFGIWYFGVRPPDRFYNGTIFAPFFFIAPFVWGAGLRSYRRGVLLGVVCFWGICSLGMVRYVAFSVYAFKVGVPISEAMELLNRTMDRYPGESVHIAQAGLVLVRDYERARLLTSARVLPGQNPDLIVIMTAKRAADSLLVLDSGFQEVAATRQPSVARWSADWCAGYSIRIFRRGDLRPNERP